MSVCGVLSAASNAAAIATAPLAIFSYSDFGIRAQLLIEDEQVVSGDVSELLHWVCKLLTAEAAASYVVL